MNAFVTPLKTFLACLVTALGMSPGLSGAAEGVTPLSVGPAGTADPATYLEGLTALFQQKWPQNRTVNIVCHGHSVPAGYFKTPVVDSLGAYPHLLFAGLKERFPFAVINVVVTAKGGENSTAGAARFDADVMSLKPDLILLDYALNDRGMGVENARQNLAKMISRAQSAGIPILLLTPTPDLASNLSDPEDPLMQQAAMIRQLAAEFHCGWVDSLTAFQEEVASGTDLPDLMAQRNHPNRRGHRLVADRILAWIPTRE